MKKNISTKSVIVATLETCAEKIFVNNDYSALVDEFPEKLVWNLGRAKIGISELKEITESLFANETFTFLKGKLTFFFDNTNVGYCQFRANLETPRIVIDKVIIFSEEFEEYLLEQDELFMEKCQNYNFHKNIGLKEIAW